MRNRFATYGKNGMISLQCALVELKSHYRILSESESWPTRASLDMASSFDQMLQSTEEMKLALGTVLQTSEKQLDVVNISNESHSFFLTLLRHSCWDTLVSKLELKCET